MKKHDYKTQFATLYYSQARGGLPIATGACKLVPGNNPLRNAKRATAAQVFAIGAFQRAEIVDRKTGLLVMSLVRLQDGRISVNLDCAGKEATGYLWREKMAEKLARRKTKKK